MSQEATRRHFDEMAPNYDQQIQSMWWATGEVLGEALDAFPGSYRRVLDLFSGTGSTLAVIKEHIGPDHILGVDFSQQMLSQLREKHKDDPRIKMVCVPIERYVQLAPPEEFDLVTAIAGLHYVSDTVLSSVVRGIARTLRPGGVLMATVDPIVWGHPTQGERHATYQGSGPQDMYDSYRRHPSEFAALLAANGLGVELQQNFMPKPRENYTDTFWVARKEN